MKKFKDIQKEEYKGEDISLEISLFKQGLIWKEDEKNITFIYGVNGNEHIYTWFDCGTIQKNIDLKKEWDWIVDWNDIFNYKRISEKEFMAMPLYCIISDLISYYGYKNIFGKSHHPFEILEE